MLRNHRAWSYALSSALCMALVFFPSGCGQKPAAPSTADISSSQVESMDEPSSLAAPPDTSSEDAATSEPAVSSGSEANMEENPPVSRVTSKPEPPAKPAGPVSLDLPADIATYTPSGATKEDQAQLFRSADALYNWLIAMCDGDYLKDDQLALYCSLSDSTEKITPQEAWEHYRGQLEQGNAVLGVYTSYPGPCQADITGLVVDGHSLTVGMTAQESSSNEGYITMLKLAVLPAGSVEQVNEVSLDHQVQLIHRYTPEVIPASPYPVRRWSVNVCNDDAPKNAALFSYDELYQWLEETMTIRMPGIEDDMTSLPEDISLGLTDLDHPAAWDEKGEQIPNPDAKDTVKEIADEFAGVFDQGQGVLALRFDNPYPEYSEVITQIERIDRRLEVHFDRYEHSGIHFCILQTHLYLIPLDAALLQGVESIETIETFYHAPQNEE